MDDLDPVRIDIKKMLEGYPPLEQILKNIKQVLWILDPGSDRILYVNPAFEFVWGRSCDSLYADPYILIKSVHPEDRVKVMSARPSDPEEALDQVYRIMQPDGSFRWISAHTFLIQTEITDRPYQVCVAQDITDQSQVDQTLRKALDRSREQFTLSRRMSLARKPEGVLKTLMAASELRAAKRAFVLFFESPLGHRSRVVEIIASWAPEPYQANPVEPSNEAKLSEGSLFEDLALSDLFHPSKSAVVSDISNDQRLSPGIRAILLEEDTHTLAVFPLVASGDWLGSLLVFFPNERYFEPIELRHIKVLVDQATIALYNLHLLEIEAESRHEAERANEIKTRFLAMISHELRTPLTSIVGFTTTLLAEDVAWEQEEQRDFILTIQQETNRLQELIDHLLDLSRLEAGMLPIVLEPHALCDILQDAMPQLNTLTREHTFSVLLPENLPPVYVDAKRIAQVLVNLVRNASIYAPTGTKIILSAGVRGGRVHLNVTDQGPGIPPAERNRVFQAFRRGVQEENSAGKGAGLGLAICKGLVEAHGGRIWVKKKSTPGATVTFTLPLVPSLLPTTVLGGQ